MSDTLYVTDGAILCASCGTDRIRDAWRAAIAEPSPKCPACAAALLTFEQARAQGRTAFTYRDQREWDASDPADFVCVECGLSETTDSDVQESGRWPQAVCTRFGYEAPDEGEYCEACHAEIEPPSDAYIGKRALEETLPTVLADIRRGERYATDFAPLPDIMEAIRNEWDDDDIRAALPPETAPDPELADLPRILSERAAATGYTSLRQYLTTAPEWAALMEDMLR